MGAKKSNDIAHFLHHDMGYNFFEIPKLTILEINSLVDIENRIRKEKESKK